MKFDDGLPPSAPPDPPPSEDDIEILPTGELRPRMIVGHDPAAKCFSLLPLTYGPWTEAQHDAWSRFREALEDRQPGIFPSPHDPVWASPPRPVQVPPKDWAKVNANVLRAKAAIDDMRPRIAHPGDLERFRIIKLALFDLDQLQTELHALLFGIADEGRFLTARGRELAHEAMRRRELLEVATAPKPEGEEQ